MRSKILSNDLSCIRDDLKKCANSARICVILLVAISVNICYENTNLLIEILSALKREVDVDGVIQEECVKSNLDSAFLIVPLALSPEV